MYVRDLYMYIHDSYTLSCTYTTIIVYVHDNSCIIMYVQDSNRVRTIKIVIVYVHDRNHIFFFIPVAIHSVHFGSLINLVPAVLAHNSDYCQ